MKKWILIAGTAVVIWASSAVLVLDAQDDPSAAGKKLVRTPIQLKLDEVQKAVQTKLDDDKTKASDLEPELKMLDALFAANKGSKTDEVASILHMKAAIYAGVLDDSSSAIKVLEELKAGYGETKMGKEAEKTIAMLKRQDEAKQMQDKLKVGSMFPDFKETDTNGKPLSISGLKGKVVLVDFWATWCGPCIKELPNVISAYEQFHSKGFEVVGISLDSSKEQLDTFIKSKKMKWPQYFDGEGWENKLAQAYGINSIPATYLLNQEGKIVASNLRGKELEVEVAKLLK